MTETVPTLSEQIMAYAATTYPESPLAMRNTVIAPAYATHLAERVKGDFDAIKQLGVEAGLEPEALASAALHTIRSLGLCL